MKIALIGLPQSGKKTLFSLLTGREVTDSRRPGEILSGKATVKDPRIDVLTEIAKPNKVTYASTEFMLGSDLELGAQKYGWVQEVKNCDLLCLVIRAFESESVFHPAGSVDAHRDEADLKMELILADLDLVEKRLERIEKDRRKLKPTRQQEIEERMLLQFRKALEAEQFLHTIPLEDEELRSIVSLNFLTLRPILVCYNVSEEQLSSPPTTRLDCNSFAVSALIEKEVTLLESADEKREFMETLGIAELGVDRLNAAAYDQLGLMSFYTVGKDEVRAWTINKGTLAPKAGGKIHTDIERGFIRVEIMKYEDLVRFKSEQEVKKQGKAAMKGQDYIIEDGDVCHFLFNV